MSVELAEGFVQWGVPMPKRIPSGRAQDVDNSVLRTVDIFGKAIPAADLVIWSCCGCKPKKTCTLGEVVDLRKVAEHLHDQPTVAKRKIAHESYGGDQNYREY